MGQEARYCLQGFAVEDSACPAGALHARWLVVSASSGDA